MPAAIAARGIWNSYIDFPLGLAATGGLTSGSALPINIIRNLTSQYPKTVVNQNKCCDLKTMFYLDPKKLEEIEMFAVKNYGSDRMGKIFISAEGNFYIGAV